jgi:hypothetical protein
VTYWQGLPGAAHAPFANQWWFTDEFADGPRRMMDAFWAVPEWAPADESHLLGSSSVVTKIAYGPGSVTYSTFDVDSEDVLRLNFAPQRVMVGGREVHPGHSGAHLNGDSYTFNASTGVLRVHHVSSGQVDIQGNPRLLPPPSYITFDTPHLPVGTALHGDYPSGVVDWGAGMWKITAPGGKFGTFNLSLADRHASQASLRFAAPRIFVGIDIYNGGSEAATVTFHSAETGDATVTVQPKELKRLKTGWREASSQVMLTLTNGQGVQFDNFAYVHP